MLVARRLTKRLLSCSAAATLSLSAATAWSAETVKAPWGWDDQRIGGQRVVTNGNAIVKIGDWQSLQGKTAEQWLQQLEHQNPEDGVILSSEGVKPEHVEGAFAVNRRVKFADQTGNSVLYVCPGLPGHARLMSLDVKNGGFTDLLRGALFGENVCKKEPRGESADDVPSNPKPARDEQRSDEPHASAQKNSVSEQASTSIRDGSPTSDEKLRTLNQQIPDQNRPTGARSYLEGNWVGFPAMLVHSMTFVLDFADGTHLSCSDWDPLTVASAASLKSERGCEPDDEDAKAVKAFKPGERIELVFGRISGYGIDGLSGSASSLSGGDLVMSKDGRIAVGRWNVNHIGVEAASARATSTRKEGLVGRYYLNGNTITIVSLEGEVTHGFIGYSTDEETGKIIALYLNGEHYWDRKKKK